MMSPLKYQFLKEQTADKSPVLNTITAIEETDSICGTQMYNKYLAPLPTPSHIFLCEAFSNALSVTDFTHRIKQVNSNSNTNSTTYKGICS